MTPRDRRPRRARPHRGGAAAGARAPRVRGLRGAARHRDPARASTRSASTLPPERELAERLDVSRATLREAMAALRAGRAGRDHAGPRRRHRGHPQAAHAVRPRRGPDRRRRGARTGSTRSTSAGSSSPARPRWPPSRDLDDDRARPARGGARRAVAAARKPAAAPAGRLAVPPDRGRADRVAARRRGGDLGAGDPARDAAGDPGAARPTSPTPTASTRRWCGRSWTGSPTGPAGSWRSTATTRPRCCAACVG